MIGQCSQSRAQKHNMHSYRHDHCCTPLANGVRRATTGSVVKRPASRYLILPRISHPLGISHPSLYSAPVLNFLGVKTMMPFVNAVTLDITPPP